MNQNQPNSPQSARKGSARKSFLVYPKFQLPLIAVNALIVLVVFGMTLFQSSRVFHQFEEIGRAIQLSPDHSYFKLIEFQSKSLYSSLMISFAIEVVLAGAVTLLISHRLAGPIIRLRKYFKDMGQSQSFHKPLKFRKGDYFDDLPEVINTALKSITK